MWIEDSLTYTQYIYLFHQNDEHFYKEKHKDMLLNYTCTEHLQKVFNKENRKSYKSNARTFFIVID